MADPSAVVRRYYEVVGDLGSSADDLLGVLHPDVQITEHPNAVNPRGSVRDRDAAVAGFLAGKEILSAQSFELHEVLVVGERVAVRATWKGTLAKDAGPLSGGTDLIAHVAAMLTVADGLIREHETFDCYEPIPAEPS